jgi:hypothetical protein
MNLKRSWLWVGVAILALAFLYLPSLGIGVGQLLLFLLVLACPLMHFLGGHRHGGHGEGDSEATGPSAPGKPQIGARDRETR